jgi:hypothetical protein
MTLKFRPRPHWHNTFKCWCDPPPPVDWDRIPLAGFCDHGVGMLDQCDDCCPPAEVKT